MARLLVVDDHKEFLDAFVEALQAGGHEVISAGDGKAALRLFQTEEPDLLITDILMPEKDGLEVILEMRRERPDIRIIAVSSGGRIGAKYVLQAAEALGADRVFTKPLEFKDVLAAVDELLAS